MANLSKIDREYLTTIRKHLQEARKMLEAPEAVGLCYLVEELFGIEMSNDEEIELARSDDELGRLTLKVFSDVITSVLEAEDEED